MCTFSKMGTRVLRGLAPFVAILSLISICKKSNYMHMETIDKKKSLKFLLLKKTP